MRTIFRAAVDVARKTGRRHGEAVERFRREALLERLFERGDTEHAARAGARYRDANVAAALRHEHADERKTRGRIAELDVAGLLGQREIYLGDDLVVLERGFEQAFEEIIGRDAALGGDDGRAEAEAGGGVIGVRVVVGNRAAERAHVAHVRVADHFGQLGERRKVL